MTHLEELVIDRHPEVRHVCRLFAYDHLRDPLRDISVEFHDLACMMVRNIHDDPELVVGLRRLADAKDAFVRAKLFTELPIKEEEQG